MSGGHYDYAYARVDEFASRLREDVAQQGEMDRYGFLRETWSVDVSRELRAIADLAEHVAKLMRSAEWLYSGDTGEQSFLADVQRIHREGLLREGEE